MSLLLSIGEMAYRLGVAVGRLRRWDREGRLQPKLRTVGGHRRYAIDENDCADKTVLYARVSCADQKDDLERQKARLLAHAQATGWKNTEIIADLGSGMNYRKRGLKRLLAMILTREVSRLVVENKDRLLRFGADLVFWLCQLRAIEVVVIEADAQANFEVGLASRRRLCWCCRHLRSETAHGYVALIAGRAWLISAGAATNREAASVPAIQSAAIVGNAKAARESGQASDGTGSIQAMAEAVPATQAVTAPLETERDMMFGPLVTWPSAAAPSTKIGCQEGLPPV